MEEVDGGGGRILLSDVDSHWYFRKPDSNLVPTASFTLDLSTINKAIAEPLGLVENSYDNANSNKSFSNIKEIIRGLQVNSQVQFPLSDASEPAADLIDNDVNMLDVNEPRVYKAKERSVGAKNKKGTITRAEKAKAKSTRRDSSDFEHVDAAIQASRGGKRKVGGGGRGKAVSSKAIGKKQKQKKSSPVTAATIEADRQALISLSIKSRRT
jgi:hypothetical protein